jgi:hypothetical protein
MVKFVPRFYNSIRREINKRKTIYRIIELIYYWNLYILTLNKSRELNQYRLLQKKLECRGKIVRLAQAKIKIYWR